MVTLRIGERGIGQKEEGGRLGRGVKEIRESREEGERAYSEEERARKSTRSTVENSLHLMEALSCESSTCSWIWACESLCYGLLGY